MILCDVTDPDRFVHVEDVDEFIQKGIPENTKAKVQWAVRIFKAWHDTWKCRTDGGLKVFNDYEEMSVNEVNFCLKHFFVEVRKVNGEVYPPRTLKQIAAAIQHDLQHNKKLHVSIFLDREFIEARDALDAAMKHSAREGAVKPTKRASTVSYSQEDALWENGTFGVGSPQQLVDTLIYHLGLHLALRARQEHRDLLFGAQSQLCLETMCDGKERLKYVERCSKNRDFGLKNCRREPKVSYIYPNEDPRKCVVALYKTYVSHR